MPVLPAHAPHRQRHAASITGGCAGLFGDDGNRAQMVVMEVALCLRSSRSRAGGGDARAGALGVTLANVMPAWLK